MGEMGSGEAKRLREAEGDDDGTAEVMLQPRRCRGLPTHAHTQHCRSRLRQVVRVQETGFTFPAAEAQERAAAKAASGAVPTVDKEVLRSLFERGTSRSAALLSCTSASFIAGHCLIRGSNRARQECIVDAENAAEQAACLDDAP